jgi:hypothetical protein
MKAKQRECKRPSTVRTSEIPNRGCQADRLVGSSAIEICSESGMRAAKYQWQRHIAWVQRTLQMPHATVHSSLVAEAWLAWHSMPTIVSVRPRYLYGVGYRYLHRSMMWLRHMAQLSTTMSHAQRATAFHYGARQYMFNSTRELYRLPS